MEPNEPVRRRLPVVRQRRTAEERRSRRRFQLARVVVQAGVLLVCVASIWRFHRFVQAVLGGAPGDVTALRSPGFEAWTPIAALVSLAHWVTAGEFDRVHPAGLLILLGALLAALLIRGGFCGWICPVGGLFDWLARLGRKLGIRRERALPAWIDIPLRALPWVLLLFFAWGAVFLGDYYYHTFDRYADVGMYGYWAWGRVGPVFLSIVAISAAGGLVIHRFWCRYLCPYGALTQVASKLSPWRVRRTEEACTDCGRCDRACPSLLVVSKAKAVSSARCLGCGLCVAACPEKHALHVEWKLPWLGARKLGWALSALLAVIGFGALPLLGQATGRWQTTISADDYRSVIPAMRDGTFDRHHVLSKAPVGVTATPRARDTGSTCTREQMRDSRIAD